eukprot:11814293-Alexandrium_andersonii.AAC.1
MASTMMAWFPLPPGGAPSVRGEDAMPTGPVPPRGVANTASPGQVPSGRQEGCLLYTSDAADDM